ncbi:cation transporter [Lawsonibacter sp. LCP25S3_F5]|jgi:copper chaperone CopZ
MKKTFKLIDLDCANCAAKMEAAIKKLDGVNDASVSFLSQKMTIDAEDDKFDEIVKQAVKVCKKVEPDCEVVVK